MTVLQPADFTAAWVAKLGAASKPFDGRTALPAWLIESARDQADRLFLVLDSTPVGKRFMEDAEALIHDAGMAMLLAWEHAMVAFRTDAEPWAAEAAEAAALAYRDHLDELAPMLRTGGIA